MARMSSSQQMIQTRHHSTRSSAVYNIITAMAICLGSRDNTCCIKAFQPTLFSNCLTRNRRVDTNPHYNGMQINQILGGPSNSYRSSEKRQTALVAAATSLVQDTPDTILSSTASGNYNESQNSIDKLKVTNVSILLHLLSPFTSRQHNKLNGNKEVENSILRLGRKGNTDQAIQLYFAVHSLDRLRNVYKSKMMSLKSKGKEVDAPSVLMDIIKKDMEWDDSGSEQQISKLLALFEALQNIRPTTRLLNLAIDACARAHPVRQDMAFDLFHSACIDERAISPNVFTFGSLLASCARNRDVQTSLQLLHELESGKYPDVVPNGVIYSTVISACEKRAGVNVRGKDKREAGAHNNMVDLALELLNNATLAFSMDVDGGGKNAAAGGGIGVVGFNAAISTMARAAEYKKAIQLLDEMILHSDATPQSHQQNDESTTSQSSFSDILESSSADFTLSAPLLHIINNEKRSHRTSFVPKPDEVTFGTVLAACERAGEWEELLRIANVAKEYGVMLDGMALTSVLHSCQQLGLADEALEYLDMMKQLGNEEEGRGAINNSTNGVITERITNGRMRKGARQELRGPDGVAYRLAISACARSPGRWQDGLRLLEEMRKAAIESNNTANAPDVVAYTAAIAGCSEAGEHTHAIRLIKTMREEGIQPNVVTFSVSKMTSAS